MKLRVLGLVVLAVAGLYGCSSTATKTPPPAETPPAQQQEQPPATTSGTQAAQPFQGSPLEDPNSPLSKKVFYFPFDSSEVSADDRDTLAAHAKFLADHPQAKVTVEGNADERGSREYNLALGERRAQSVQRLLALQGAKKDQIKVVSYGEERPVATCHDESCWSKNRRVELVYSGV